MSVLCNFDGSQYFIFGPNVTPLVLYSHIPVAILSLAFGFFVFINGRKHIQNSVLFGTILFFVSWVIADSIFWASNRSDIIMFVWSFTILVEPLVHIGGAYLTFVFLSKKDVPLIAKSLTLAAYFPLVILVPTQYVLSGFDSVSCLANESLFSYYTYVIEGFSILFILSFSIKKYFSTPHLQERREILWLAVGVVFFLLCFSWGNVVGSFTEDWQLGQLGLFGMPVFIGFLAYLIVRYQAFNIKVIATQALVVTLAILIGSQLFFIKSQINFILTSITFLLSVLFGILLIRSVKNEIRRKEELQIVTDKLAAANVELKRLDQSKTEFISIASHQLRTPLTAIKGFVSLLLEGSYGAVPASIADVLDKIYTANDRIVHLVEDLLNISRMESGRLKYEYAEVNILEFLNELRDTFALVAKKKGLDLTFEVPAGALAPAWIDRQKAFEVVSNLIDNAIKYTSAGSVRVRAEGVPGFVRISVADTGVGIDPDMMPVLFQKFSRGKESGKMHVSGTGLGLYVGKSMIEAQGGHIGVTSEGAGKGSTFFVELPVKQG